MFFKRESGHQCPAYPQRIHANHRPKHPAQTQGHSHPNAPRRQSRRSSTRQGKRTHARRRPSTQSKLQRHSHPNAPRRPKPPQQHPAGYTHPTRDEGQAPGPIPSGAATQTRPGGRAAAAAPGRIYAPNAKLRAPAAAYGRIIPPNAGPRAPTTRTRQRRAAQAAQTAVGDAQERILLRDDHAESFRQRKVTSHPTPAKSAFLWGYPRFFWQDKRNGVQRA